MIKGTRMLDKSVEPKVHESKAMENDPHTKNATATSKQLKENRCSQVRQRRGNFWINTSMRTWARSYKAPAMPQLMPTAIR